MPLVRRAVGLNEGVLTSQVNNSHTWISGGGNLSDNNIHVLMDQCENLIMKTNSVLE